MLTTYKLALERLEKEEEFASIQLIRLLAFLAPEGTQDKLLRDAHNVMAEPLRTAASSGVRWQGALAGATKLALVQAASVGTNPDEPIYLLTEHRLVRAVGIALLTQEQRKHYAEEAVCVVNSITPDIMTVWIELVDAIQSFNLNISEASRLLSTTAIWFKNTGRYSEAEPLFRTAFSVLLSIPGPSHPSVRTVATNWVVCLQEMQGQGLFPYPEEQMAELMPLYHQAWAIVQGAGEG